MSDDEGVTPLQAALEAGLGAGNARFGQRGSGHSVATTVGYAPDSELDYARPASWRRGEANSTASGQRVRQHRSFAPWGKARPEKWRAEPRPEPDSGNPTVRDRRGLQETWPVGAFSTRRARLISISTPARWDLRGGQPEPVKRRVVPTATAPPLTPTDEQRRGYRHSRSQDHAAGREDQASSAPERASNPRCSHSRGGE